MYISIMFRVISMFVFLRFLPFLWEVKRYCNEVHWIFWWEPEKIDRSEANRFAGFFTSNVRIRLSLVRNWKNNKGSIQRDKDLKWKIFVWWQRQSICAYAVVKVTSRFQSKDCSAGRRGRSDSWITWYNCSRLKLQDRFGVYQC